MTDVCSQCGEDEENSKSPLHRVSESPIEWVCTACLPSYSAFSAEASSKAEKSASAAVLAAHHLERLFQQSGPHKPRTSATCIACKSSLGVDSFSASQWKRAVKGATCKACVAAALVVKAAPLFEIGETSFQLESLMREAGVRVYVVENGGDARAASGHSSSGGSSSAVLCPKAAARAVAYRALLDDVWSSRNLTSRDAWFVGVDCEGTSGDLWTSAPGKAGAMMAQVASRHVVVVEILTTRRDRGGGVSKELIEILEHEDIVKVFCDAKGDVSALIAEMAKEGQASCPRVAPSVDLQDMVRGKLASSLSQIISLSTSLPIEKQSIKKNKWWVLNTAKKMAETPGFINYAAADAWGTWLAYEQITAKLYGEIESEEGGGAERDVETLLALYSQLTATLAAK